MVSMERRLSAKEAELKFIHFNFTACNRMLKNMAAVGLKFIGKFGMIKPNLLSYFFIKGSEKLPEVLLLSDEVQSLFLK